MGRRAGGVWRACAGLLYVDGGMCVEITAEHADLLWKEAVGDEGVPSRLAVTSLTPNPSSQRERGSQGPRGRGELLARIGRGATLTPGRHFARP